MKQVQSFSKNLLQYKYNDKEALPVTIKKIMNESTMTAFSKMPYELKEIETRVFRLSKIDPVNYIAEYTIVAVI